MTFNLGVSQTTALMEASLAISQQQKASGGAQPTLEQQLQQQSKMMAAMSELEPRSVICRLLIKVN